MLFGRRHFKDIHPLAHWVWMHKFRILLFMLVGMLACYPYLIEKGKVGQTLFEIMFTGLIFVSMYVICDTRRDTLMALVLGTPALVVHAAHYLFPQLFMYTLLTACLIVFYVYMTFSVLRHVLREKSVDADIIAGSICIYLLMGMVWAMMYSLVEQITPGAFVVGTYLHDGSVFTLNEEIALVADEGMTAHFTVFLYFSYTTLTTLGYGDIIPATNAARSLTSLEAIAGILYIGAFVARLISAYRVDDRRENP